MGTNWMLDDSNGSRLSNLGQDECIAREKAQAIADARNEAVSLYLDGSVEAEVIRPADERDTRYAPPQWFGPPYAPYD